MISWQDILAAFTKERKLPNWAGATILVFASLTVSLFLCEWIVRQFPLDRTVVAQVMEMNRYNPPIEENRLPIFTFTPNAHFTHKTSEFEAEVKINNHGLRWRETPYEKPKGEFRILIIGPSLVQGWGVPIEQSMPAILESMLRKKPPEKNIVVINAGQPAKWLLNNMFFYLIEGEKYNPDLVVHLQAHDMMMHFVCR